MKDILTEPLASSLRIIFILWIIIGFWALLFTPLLAKRKTGQPYQYPRWWKLLCVIYPTSIIMVFIVAINVARDPEGVTAGFTYGALFLTVLTLFVAAPIAVAHLLYGFFRANKNLNKADLAGMAKRTCHVILAILAVVLFFWLVG